jgi:hypothetical protein
MHRSAREIVKHFNIDMLNDARAVGIGDIFAKLMTNSEASVFTEFGKSAVLRTGLPGVALPDYFLRQPFDAHMNDFVRYASQALLLHPIQTQQISQRSSVVLP